MIIGALILGYAIAGLVVASLLGRHLRRQRERALGSPHPLPRVHVVRDVPLDITHALRRPRP